MTSLPGMLNTETMATISTSRFEDRAKWYVILVDLVVMNLVFWALHLLRIYIGKPDLSNHMLTLNLILDATLLFSFGRRKMPFYVRGARPEAVVMNVFNATLAFSAYSVLAIVVIKLGISSSRFLLFFFAMVLVAIELVHIYARHFVREYRLSGGDRFEVVFIGSSDAIKDLNKYLSSDLTVGARVVGYFNDSEDEELSQTCVYLGTCSEAIPYMETSRPSQVFCGLPHEMRGEAKTVATWCQNNVVLFSSVPNVHNYFHQRAYPELVGGVPTFRFQRDPLSDPMNAFVKRSFDILVSGLFLCTLFPIVYVMVFIGTKISSPGPVFFRQKRTGMNGDEFECLKFRSMKVNKDADTLQATKDDPRKTRFGNFLRTSSLDELPQFINVFKGEMSIVGPRPHMVKHTEEYSDLIDKYMVRHFVKPGITGWAQVTGFRGETKELSQMEGRIKADIWYIEHWSFVLDIVIIVKTFTQVFIKGDKQAY